MKITEDALAEVIDFYTREAGVRNLERTIADLCRKAAKRIAEGYTGKITTASGRVVMDDLSFIQSADQLTLGLGTLLGQGRSHHLGIGGNRPNDWFRHLFQS